MTGISSHNGKLAPIYLLHTEKIAEAVLSYVFKMAFPAPLFKDFPAVFSVCLGAALGSCQVAEPGGQFTQDSRLLEGPDLRKQVKWLLPLVLLNLLSAHWRRACRLTGLTRRGGWETGSPAYHWYPWGEGRWPWWRRPWPGRGWARYWEGPGGCGRLSMGGRKVLQRQEGKMKCP